jgi:Virulence-associated protein E
VRPGPSADGSLPIWCPWGEDHTGDSGPSETVYWPAGTGAAPGGGVYAQGHFKCLHAHCEQREDNDFLTAIGFAQSFEADFAVVDAGITDLVGPLIEPQDGRSPVPRSNGAGGEAIPAAWLAAEPGKGMKRGKKGWIACLENLTQAVDTDGFWLRLGYDAFRQELVASDWHDPIGEEQWSALTNAQLIAGRKALGRAGFELVGREIMRDACELVAHSRRFDALELWLAGRHWDGTGRVDSFLQTYYGAADTPYTRAVGAYWWTALAGRALVPGCKADMVPILVGAQGIGKTRSLESLAPWPETYRTIDLGVRDAELSRRMRGTCLWELNELRGLHSRARTAINSFITERADVWRPLYQEFDVVSPRRGLFIGTTNDDAFLDDETGNRRWLPVAVAQFGELTAYERDQLWAEGAARFVVDGVDWSAAEALGQPEHEDFRMVDAWEDALQQWMRERFPDAGPFTLSEAGSGALGISTKDFSKGSEQRVAKILRAIGCTSERVRGYRGERVKRKVWHVP